MKDVSSSRGSHECSQQPDLDATETDGTDWFIERDRAKMRLFETLHPYRKYGVIDSIPVNLVSAYLRCDLCEKPRKQSTHVYLLFKVLYCPVHAKAEMCKQKQSPRYRTYSARRQQIEADHEAIWGGIE